MPQDQAQPDSSPDDLLHRIERLITHKQADRARRLAMRAIAEGRESPALRTLLGRALADLGDRPAAQDQFAAALRLAPEHAPAFLHRGLARLSQGQLTAALDDTAKAHASTPGNPETLLALWQCEQALCQWQDRHPRLAELALNPPPRFLFPPRLARQLVLTATEYRSISLRWNEALHRRLARVPRARRLVRDFGCERPLQLAYLAAAESLPLLAALAKLHDRARIRPQIYLSRGPVPASGLEADITLLSQLSPRRGAQRIADAQVDILVDLCGDTCSHAEAILALRPAPVQVRWMGPPGTSGAPHVDWLLTDAIATPFSEAASHTERLAYLPNCAWLPEDGAQPASAAQLHNWLQGESGAANPSSNTVGLKERLREDAPSRRNRRFIAAPRRRTILADEGEGTSPTRLRDDLGLPGNALVFASFIPNGDLPPEIFDSWLKVLNRVPEGILWLPGIAPQARPGLQARAGKAAARLAFLPAGSALPARPSIRRALLQIADIYLAVSADVGNCADALVAEIPTVGLATKGRQGALASLLSAAGLAHLVAASAAGYEDIAVQLASERGALETQQVRLQLNKLVAPLFHTERNVRNLEEAFHMIWAAFLDCRHITRLDVPDVGDGAPAGELPAPGQARPSTLARSAMLAYLRGEPSAEELCKQALMQNLNDPIALELLGLQALDKGRPEAADRLLRKALAAAPRPDSLAYLGAALLMQGRLDEANHAHLRAQRLKPCFAQPLATLRNELVANTPWPTARNNFRSTLQQQAWAT